MKANENKKFLRYNFYQKALKLGKKYYFLLDFFYGLKGFFLYKEKIIKKKKLFVYAKSFNKFFFVPRIKKNKFDYFLNSSYNLNYSNEFYKKKGNIFLSALIKKKLVYSSNLTNLWLLQYFLDLKKVYTQLLCLKLFNNFNYLNIYYNFIKHNYIIKNFIFLKKYFV
jgi:hypothetical protein